MDLLLKRTPWNLHNKSSNPSPACLVEGARNCCDPSYLLTQVKTRVMFFQSLPFSPTSEEAAHFHTHLELRYQALLEPSLHFTMPRTTVCSYAPNTPHALQSPTSHLLRLQSRHGERAIGLTASGQGGLVSKHTAGGQRVDVTAPNAGQTLVFPQRMDTSDLVKVVRV